jgi:hypothetical protein
MSSRLANTVAPDARAELAKSHLAMALGIAPTEAGYRT